MALLDARNHTLHLFAQYQAALESTGFKVPQLATVNPPLWELGHIGWFQEWWIGRNMQRAAGPWCEPEHARLASIEPQADPWWNSSQVPHAARWSLALPGADHIRAYLLETLESTLELLDKTSNGNNHGHNSNDNDNDNALYFYRLALFHEDMHGEALVSTAQTLGLALPPAMQTAFTPAPMALREPLLIPACQWLQGSKQGAGCGFAFDNEQPQHLTSVPAFEIDAQVVTWAQYVEFVLDGGYDQPALWHPQGWQWLQAQDKPGPGGEMAQGRRAPRYIAHIGAGSGAVVQTRFGQAHRMQGHQAALHMTWWEADAWCRWAGRRLPFEVEWELAAQTASRRGFRWGDVWEWTASTFQPYQSSLGFPAGSGSSGFRPDPYVDYSQPWFGTHKVLRGGSFATRARMKSPTYRNFYLPERDDVFCGFRSCAL